MALKSANAAARITGVSINLIRRMIADHTCPGVQIGNRFYVNVDLLVAKLDEQSRANDKSNAAAAS